MKFKEFLRIEKNNYVAIEDKAIYTIAGVQNYGKGIVNRRQCIGAELTMKKYQVITPNQLMWCKVDTKNGAFGITRDEHDGALASTNMCLANIDTTLVYPPLLELLFSVPWFYEEINGNSTGTTNRKYLTPVQVLNDLEFPDLSIAKQIEVIKKYRHIQDVGFLKDIDSQLSHIQLLRQTILQEAVQGKLVPQNPKDEPASELLKKIQGEKEQLIKQGKLKKSKPLPPISEDEIPYDLPMGWEWARLGDVCLKITDGTHHSPPNLLLGEFMYVTAKNIKEFGVDLSNITHVSKQIHEEIYSRCNPEIGDILYIKDGATTGVVAINNVTEQFSLLSSVALLKLPSELHNKYLMYYMRSPFYYNTIRSDMAGIAITRVTLTKISHTVIPVPPISEQIRIAAKVEQLMLLCDELEQQVQQSKADAEKLLQAVLREAFDVKQEQHEPLAMAAEGEVAYKMKNK